jgi:hypothetical protein
MVQEQLREAGRHTAPTISAESIEPNPFADAIGIIAGRTGYEYPVAGIESSWGAKRSLRRIERIATEMGSGGFVGTGER